MHVERVGFTSLKGGRHISHDTVELTLGGPVGDRRYCLVDLARRRVLRTVEHPAMVQVVARAHGDVLALELPDGSRVEDVPRPSGERLEVDYWGRPADLELLDGPSAAALARHVGHDVRLARVSRPGEVVYGAPVSLVTTASLRLLAERVGAPVASERFRATFLVRTDEPHVEDAWVGRELSLGAARLRVRSRIPRCAVVDLDPASGTRDTPVLTTLGRYRAGEGAIWFGVDAEVVGAGVVDVGASLAMGRN